jgi:hypothetical protein
MVRRYLLFGLGLTLLSVSPAHPKARSVTATPQTKIPDATEVAKAKGEKIQSAQEVKSRKWDAKWEPYRKASAEDIE